MNKAVLMGRLTKDPELKTTQHNVKEMNEKQLEYLVSLLIEKNEKLKQINLYYHEEIKKFERGEQCEKRTGENT